MRRVPGTDKLGLNIAALMGLIGGNSGYGLRVLEVLDEEQVKLAEYYMDKNILKISPVDTEKKVYIEVILKGHTNIVKVIIREKHDKFVYISKNNEVLLNEEAVIQEACLTTEEENLLEKMSIKELIQEVENIESEDIKFLIDGIAMNKKIADYALEKKIGIGVGYGIKQSIEDGLLGDDLINSAMMLTAAADARMSGIKMPVMSSNGSGNHGITAILPIVAYNNKFPQSEEKLAKALAISHLITAYIKNYTGRLSAVCGCGVAASTGASAAITWLMGGSYKQIEGSIENMIANLSGMICDGAKSGCALKLASSASAAVQSSIIAKYNCIVPPLNGIVGNNVEESIRNLGKVSSQGMIITDETIINIMDDMNKVI
ncbi:L-cysteine desulfidase [Asaccharospora irregularis DSM 2635]|uniref:L-cysteine desulfidase n=1 Tax=Asaccharospora irregularis DSM 2635 TaxID=1121321 RepID=A0A1M5KAR9_9FIRM|nr:L-serine ammonia-lyase, iron-sulfur-dependent, subunit alpha [Asaccharospora irregularis]SHG49867.1 L-cysteine desulfidase [Asaccharospora irregularis DSM 2635]